MYIYKGIKLFINHDRCPNCGAKIKRYYWNCRNCGSQDLTNWPSTLTLWAGFILLIGILIFFIINNFCKTEWFLPLMNSYALMC